MIGAILCSIQECWDINSWFSTMYNGNSICITLLVLVCKGLNSFQNKSRFYKMIFHDKIGLKTVNFENIEQFTNRTEN